MNVEDLVDTLKIKYFIFGWDNIAGGVNNKILSQVSELIRLGLDIEIVMITIGEAPSPRQAYLNTYPLDTIPPNNIVGRVKRALLIRKIFGETIESLGPNDILYHRYSGPSPLYYPYKYFRRFRICRVVTEHQTKELDEFKLAGDLRSYWSELFFGKLMKMQSDAIIGVTDEIAEYEVSSSGDPGKPRMTIGNGFSVRSVPSRKVPPFDGEELHLICAANVSPWHGLDRLIRGFAMYLGRTKVVLHIAGDGSEVPNLKKMVSDLDLTDRVIFHGFLTGPDLNALYDQCHVAVGSLGIHRIGLREASILKAREYCARGIPFIYGIADPDFSGALPFILRVPAEETPVDIQKVLAFARTILGDSDQSKKMRHYAENHLDWSVKMRKLKDFLETLISENRDAYNQEVNASLPTAKD